MAGDDYLGGMIAAYPDAVSTNEIVGSVFAGDATLLAGASTAYAVTNGSDVTNGILTNTSTVSAGWIALQSTNVGGTNRLLVLGYTGTNSPIWRTNYSQNINSWTNSAQSNSLVLRLSGESKSPVDANYAFEFSEFVIVPIGDLTYSSTNLPSGLTIDPVTGLITGTLPATNLNLS